MPISVASTYQIVEVLTAITILIKAVGSMAASLRKAFAQLISWKKA